MNLERFISGAENDHRPKKSFICDACPREFSTKVQYQVHCITHMVENNFDCEECQMGFIHIFNLDEHFKSHNSQTVFVCDQCNEEFVDEIVFKEHEKKHNAEIMLRLGIPVEKSAEASSEEKKLEICNEAEVASQNMLLEEKLNEHVSCSNDNEISVDKSVDKSCSLSVPVEDPVKKCGSALETDIKTKCDVAEEKSVLEKISLSEIPDSNKHHCDEEITFEDYDGKHNDKIYINLDLSLEDSLQQSVSEEHFGTCDETLSAENTVDKTVPSEKLGEHHKNNVRKLIEKVVDCCKSKEGAKCLTESTPLNESSKVSKGNSFACGGQPQEKCLVLIIKPKDSENLPVHNEHQSSASSKLVPPVRVESSDNKNALTCSVCEKKFRKQANFDVHMRRHIAQNQSLNNVQNKQATKEHATTSKNAKLFLCQVCLKMFASSDLLNAHLLTHAVGNKVPIPNLQKVHRQQHLLIPSAGNKVANLIPNPKKPALKVVQQKDSVKKLNKHAESDPKKTVYICGVCHAKFTEKAAIDQHVQTHTSQNKSADDAKGKQAAKKKLPQTSKSMSLFVCGVCHKLFLSSSLLDMHLKTHSPGESVSSQNKRNGAVHQSDTVKKSKFDSSLESHQDKHVSNHDKGNAAAHQSDIVKKSKFDKPLESRQDKNDSNHGNGNATAHQSVMAKKNKIDKPPENCQDKSDSNPGNGNVVAHQSVTTKESKIDKPPENCQDKSDSNPGNGNVVAHQSVTTKESKIDKPLESHQDKNVYACNVSQRKFMNESNLDNRIQTHKLGNKSVHEKQKGQVTKKLTPRKVPEASASATLFVCNVCRKVFYSSHLLNEHILSHNAGGHNLNEGKENAPVLQIDEDESQDKLEDAQCETPKVSASPTFFDCDVCYEVFTSPRSLNEHISTHNACGSASNEGKENAVVEQNDVLEVESFCDELEDPVTEEWVLDKSPETSKSTEPMICGLCKKPFENLQLLNKHLLTHVTDEAYLCGFCSAEFSSKQLLKVHVREHRQKKNFAGVSSKSKILKRIRTPAKVYTCSTCQITFSDRLSFIKHRRTHPREKSVECSVCHKKFYTQSQLSMHFIYHSDEKSHACDKCEKKFHTKRQLEMHSVVHSTAKPYACDQCGKRFRTKQILGHHGIVHSEKQFVCTKCNKSFHLKKIFERHCASHLQEKPNDCHVCLKSFSSAHNLQRHLLIHEGKLFPCDICGKSFTTKIYFDGHYKIHTEVPRYKCDYCEKRFRFPAHLKEHIRRHTGEKPFLCDTCGKSFITAVRLKLHAVTHSNEKNFVCAACGKKFARKLSLKTHLNLHVGQSPYMCDICPKPFTTKQSLQKHMRRLHQN